MDVWREKRKLVIVLGTLVYSLIAGRAQAVVIKMSLLNCQAKLVKFRYLNEILEKLKLILMEEEQYLHI